MSKFNPNKLMQELKKDYAETHPKHEVNQENADKYPTLKEKLAGLPKFNASSDVQEISAKFKKDVMYIVNHPKEFYSEKTKTFQMVIPIQLLIRDLLNERKSVNHRYMDLVHLMEIVPEESVDEETELLLMRELRVTLLRRRALKTITRALLTTDEYGDFERNSFINNKYVYTFARKFEPLEQAVNANNLGWTLKKTEITKRIAYEQKEVINRFNQLDAFLNSKPLYTLKTTQKYYNSTLESIDETFSAVGKNVYELFPSVINDEQKQLYFSNQNCEDLED